MWRLMSYTLVAILGIGVAGNVIDWDWAPPSYTAPDEFAVIPPAPLEPPPDLHPHAVREDVSIPVDGELVEAFVYSPPAPGPHPGVVFIHGAGTKDRTGFEEQADFLARAGVVALVMDKRTADYSPWHRDFEAMAADPLAGAEVLRDRPDVDPHLVGLFGESEGAWVAPIAAARDPRIAFSILVSAPIVSPAEQATYATLMAIRDLDVPRSVDRAVVKGMGIAISVPNLLEYAEFDVRPWLAAASQPVLLVYGTDDPALPIIEGADLARSAAAGPVTVRYFAGAQHGIRIGDANGPFAPGYLDALHTWIDQQTNGDALPGPDIAGGQPEQTLAAEAVPTPPWYATAQAHLVIGGLVVAGYIAAPVATAESRRRSRNGWRPMTASRRRSLRRVRVLGISSLASLVLYYVALSHLALNQETNAVIIYGGWTLVWLITAGTVLALIHLRFDEAWWQQHNPGTETSIGHAATETTGPAGEQPKRLGGQRVATAGSPRTIAETAALIGTVAGTLLLLLTVTYWGVFRVI
jgi:uncharacterized protein